MDKRLAEIGRALTAVTVELEYMESVDPFVFEKRSDQAWAFCKTGEYFLTQVVSFMIRLEPLEMVINFIASDLAVNQLQKVGIFGHGALANLFDYQLYTMKLPPSELLPKVINFDEIEVEEVLKKLRAELLRVDPVIWRDLSARSSVQQH